MELISITLEITKDSLYLSDFDSQRIRKRILIANIRYIIINEDSKLTIIDAQKNNSMNETTIETNQYEHIISAILCLSNDPYQFLIIREGLLNLKKKICGFDD